MTRKSILFVDDEPNILAGLKRMLRPLRNTMDIMFAESGQEALACLREHHIDVMVSDMRMPGMDGAELLTRVQRHYPHTIRIMLSGQADEESTLRTVGVVHQFIAKPSDPETLKGVLGKACALQDLMQNEQLQALVAGLGSLPSLPAVYDRLQQQLRNPECSLADIAGIIEQDLAMSAKVLQLVNSAFFGMYKQIDSTVRAVNLLGLDTIRALVLSVGVFTELRGVKSKVFSVQSLWNHSKRVAAFAKTIAQTESGSKELTETVFVAGFLHDIGKLLLYSSVRDKYIEAVELALGQQLTLCQAERQIFQASHGAIGGYLLGIWGLPGGVVEAAAFHHQLESYPEASCSPPLIVHAADCIDLLLHPDALSVPPRLDQDYLERAGLAGRFEHWLERCRDIEL